MKTRYLIYTSLFIAIAIVLAQVVKIIPIGTPGAVLLPLHIPILLCGFVCGKKYGLLAGIITPLVSFLITGMPMIFPIGLSMMFELGTYGFMAGFLYKNLKVNPYISLLVSMLVGRAIYGIAAAILFSFANFDFGLQMFIQAAFVVALPGIIIQLIIIVPLVKAIEKIEKRNNFSQVNA
ncbi:ECF transporter S component [Solibacillus sp. CAU 1738]|uniref:ECF transporter S component n=1 Tax=Solibacillus sp. CAU 1738 TaxID=3140363 RepID=UPI0032612F52